MEPELPPIVLPKKRDVSKIYNRLNKYYELGRNVEGHYYEPSEMFYLLYFMYLSAKYRKVCFHTKEDISNIDNGILVDLDLTHDNEANLEQDINAFVANLLKCMLASNDRFVFPFIIMFGNTDDSHANLFIYHRDHDDFNKATAHTVEHFEPHGPSALTDPMYSKVTECLEKIIDKLREVPQLAALNYLDIPAVCPRMGVQTIETAERNRRSYEDGYCAGWTMLVTELMIENPVHTSKDITDILIGTQPYVAKHGVKLQTYFLALMRGYTRAIEATLNKYYANKLGMGKLTYQKLGNIDKWPHMHSRMNKLFAHVSLAGIIRTNMNTNKEYQTIFQNITPLGSMSKSPQRSKSKTARRRNTVKPQSPAIRTRRRTRRTEPPTTLPK